jgi:hypothetical protein
MALSPQDREFYEEKLSMKSFGYVIGSTILLGSVAWPLMNFTQDWSNGLAGRWNGNIVFDFAAIGFLLGLVVSVVLYLGFKFLLEVGWLPSRRQD